MNVDRWVEHSAESAVRPRVIIFDDTEVDRYMVRRMIGDRCDLLEASDEESCRRLVDASNPDCLLLDYRIPGTDTLALLQEMRSRGLPVVMVTGMGSERIAVGSMKLGASDYLPKENLSREKLLICISHCIERQRLESRIIEKQRALEEFAHTASHDLRAPLIRILQILELLELEHGGAVPQDARALMNSAKESCAEMDNLIVKLLAYSLAGSVELEHEAVDLNRLCDKVLRTLEFEVHSKNALVERAQLPQVSGSPTMLEQVLQNLIGNSLKFTRDGVRPHITVSTRDESQRHVITVSDNGIGVPPHFRQRAFEPFSRAKETRGVQGSGIGLATCRKIVTRHGGDIWFEPAPDAGCAISFSLPKMSGS